MTAVIQIMELLLISPCYNLTLMLHVSSYEHSILSLNVCDDNEYEWDNARFFHDDTDKMYDADRYFYNCSLGEYICRLVHDGILLDQLLHNRTYVLKNI